MSTHDALIGVAREGEPDRLAAALLAPEPQRSALLALAAFAAELRRIPTSVKEPMMGEVRLQWWRDAITSATATGNPVADALVAAIAAHGLPPSLLIAMTEARAFDLYPDPMPDEAALDGYLTKTEGALFEMALRVMGRTAGIADQQLIANATRCYGLARIACDLPQRLARGRSPFPVSRLRSAGFQQSEPWPPTTGDANAPEFGRLFEGLADDIMATYDAARTQVVTLSRTERFAFLPLAVVPSYLRRIRAVRGVPSETIVLQPILRMSRIAMAHAIGRV